MLLTFVENNSEPFDVKYDVITLIQARSNGVIRGENYVAVQVVFDVYVPTFPIVLGNCERFVQTAKVGWLKFRIWLPQGNTYVSISFNHEFIMTAISLSCSELLRERRRGSSSRVDGTMINVPRERHFLDFVAAV